MKRARGKETKGRGTKDKPRAKIYIFTEGDTEEIYLKHFQARKYNAEVIPNPKDSKHTDAIGIVKCAKEFIETEGLDLELGDRVYCAFDSDPKSNTNISLAFDLIKGAFEKGLRCIFSNPSFEVWFLLHIKETAPRGLTASQMKKRLRHELEDVFPDYCETTDIYDWLRDKQDLAQERARKLHDSQKVVYKKVLSHECNPYTNMFEFMDYINSIKV